MTKERKTAQVVTRITPDDREWLDRESERQGLNPSTFIRMTLRRERAARDQAQPQLAVA